MMASRDDELRGTLQGSRSKSITLLQVATDSADNNSATVYPENAPTEVSINSEIAELEGSIFCIQFDETIELRSIFFSYRF